ncbi:hypothetical protein L7F22_008107 [Adiantum nelumboides]|nr:hypothetical protein [Adiantum nelumboides]
MKIWGCSQADANGRVHAFFESEHFKDGNIPTLETYQSLVQLVEFCDLVIVTSRQHVIRHQTLEWIERHFPRIFSDMYFGNHFALEGEARPKSEICMNARFKGHPAVLPELVLVEQVVLTPSIELENKDPHAYATSIGHNLENNIVDDAGLEEIGLYNVDVKDVGVDHVDLEDVACDENENIKNVVHEHHVIYLEDDYSTVESQCLSNCYMYLEHDLNTPTRVTMVMEVDNIDDFVEVGLIRSTHGVKGELKVMSLTDFPEQRFERPGIRWVGFYRMGKLVGACKIDLLCGRKIMQGKDRAWLLTFEGVDSKEKASELVGATILVENADRPVLNADQFYIPELIGMSVQMKDSGNVIGSIVDIFNSGASDLLRVKLSESEDNQGGNKEVKDSLIWIPFVKEIVPIVDKKNRFVEITPPQGLLELNALSKPPLKQELRKQTLRSKRKLQDRMAGVRKKVLAMKQEHILSGLTHGDELQREALKMQLLTFDFSSLKRAMETSSADFKLGIWHAGPCSDADAFSSPIPPPLDWEGLSGWLRSSPKELDCGNEVIESTWRLWRGGLRLITENKVAIVALASGDMTDAELTNTCVESNLEDQAGQVLAMQELAEMVSGERPLIPWVVVVADASAEYVRNLLKAESYFGLSEQQVHFVTLSCLPYVSYDDDSAQKILMESQWRIIAGAGGDGHVIGDLDDSGVLNALVEMGVTYFHLCSMEKSLATSLDPVIFGVMDDQNACVGIKVTSAALEGDHGILCLRKASVDGRSRSLFISESEKAAGAVKSVIEIFEHFPIVKPHDAQNTGSCALKDDEPVYRVPSSCSYTLSAEYLRHLSLQRHGFIYEREVKRISFIGPSSESTHHGAPVIEENALQLKCSLDNALMFCSPSKVVLLNCDKTFVYS